MILALLFAFLTLAVGLVLFVLGAADLMKRTREMQRIADGKGRL